MMTSPVMLRGTAPRAAFAATAFHAKTRRPDLRRCAAGASLIAAVACFASVTFAAGYTETDLVANTSPLKDANGINHNAKFVDTNLQNPWGVAESGNSPFWVSDNGAGVSTLYNTAGTPQLLKVSIPAPGGDPLGSDGAPTGIVFNIALGQGAFPIKGVDRTGAATTAPAVFLFATEDGTILGWNPNVDVVPPPTGFAGPNGASTHAIIAVTKAGAIYKGLAIAMPMLGSPPLSTPLLYATDFHDGTVDVFDASFGTPSTLPAGAFTDPTLPRGYAPFNIAPIGGEMFVTYAVQDEDAEDDVAGQGHGIVNTFTPDGKMLARFAQHGQLDSPWGVTLAPATFGEAAGKLLIGNFGNGHINIFDPTTGEFLDKLRDTHGQALVIDGLWTLMFGNGVAGGSKDLLYFTAGPNDEADGLFGSIAPSP
jgi:uncharacterized protein (TIGR03118 family)